MKFSDYTAIQDRPDETINWVVDVEDLVSDIQSIQVATTTEATSGNLE